MKLKTFILTVLTAGFLFSCSSESEPPVVNPPVEINASFSLAVNQKGLTGTKAVSITEGFSDAGISTLTVAIFDNGAWGNAREENLLRVVETISIEAGSALEITDIPVPAGDMKVLVLANASDVTLTKEKTLLAEVLAAETKLENEEPGQLTMSSAVLDIKTFAEVKNYLGYSSEVKKDGVILSAAPADGVELYRTPARLQLTGIKVGKTAKLANSVEIGVDANLDVKAVFIMNAKRTSKVASQGAWGFVESANNNWYAGDYSEKTGLYKTHAAQTGEEQDFLYVGYTDKNIEADKSASFTDAFYIYENGLEQGSSKAVSNHNGDYTLLVIQGDYSFKPQTDAQIEAVEKFLKDEDHVYVYDVTDGVYTVKYCFYTVQINNGDNCVINGVANHKYVKRNVKYEISATINSIGSNNPVDIYALQYVNARVVVADWNVVTIDDDDLW